MIQQNKAIKLLISLIFILSFASIVASAAPFAYITNYNSNNVSVIDTSTNTVTGTVTVGTQPFGVAVNPEGTRVYVTNQASNNVSVIDTSTNTVTATVTVGTKPSGVAMNPAGTRVYVTNFGSSNVSVIDTSTNTVTATVTVGTRPFGVAVNPAGTRVYVANLDSNSVSVIDTSTNTVTATVTVGTKPIGVAVNPEGTRVYVANFGSSNVSVIDTSTNTVTATVTVGTKPYGVAVNPAGTHVYVANYDSNSVSVIDTSTNTVTTVTVGENPHAFGIFISPEGASTYNNPEFVNITIDGDKSIIFANHSDSITEGNWISLKGGDPIELPSPFTLTYYGTNFSSTIKDGKTINVTVDVEDNTDYVVPYPHTTHDMFTNVPGKNNVNMYFNGTTCFANDCTDVYLVKMSKTSLKDAFNDITDGNIAGFYYNLLGDPYETKLNEPLDVNGDMNLAFSEVDAGDYAIFILLNNSDLYNKSILSTTTFQVLDYDSTTTVPSEVIRGNMFNADITLTNAPTDTYTYGAALVHESAYYAEMQLRFNGTRAGTNLTLNDVDIIQGYEVLGVGLSSVNMTTVLNTISYGIDSTDGYVENTTINANNTSITLETSGLDAGNYFLLTGVYSSEEKLVAFSQSEIIISDTLTPTILVEDVTAAPNGYAFTSIIVNNVTDLGSGNVSVTFDPSAIQVIDVTSGDENALTVQDVDIDNTAGSLEIAAWDAAESHNGDVVFAHVTLHSIGDHLSSTALAISSAELINYDTYEPITHNVATGTLDTIAPIVIIDNVEAVSGESTTALVMVNNASNLGSGRITITYNSSVVHVTNVTSGDGNALAVQDWNVDNTTGSVQILAQDGDTSYNGDVVLAIVTFHAVGEYPDSTPLDISSSELIDYTSYGIIGHSVTNGTFSIFDNEPPVITDAIATPDVILNDNGRPRVPGTNVTVLNATVLNGGSGVANVTINLSLIGGSNNQVMERIAGTDVWTVTTNAIDGINLTHELVITATDWADNKNTSVIELTVLLRGDVVRDGDLNSADAFYIAKYLVGKEPRPSLIVGDMSPAKGDGVITSADALYLAKYLVGKEVLP